MADLCSSLEFDRNSVQIEERKRKTLLDSVGVRSGNLEILAMMWCPQTKGCSLWCEVDI
jgi:hypothetical protein